MHGKIDLFVLDAQVGMAAVALHAICLFSFDADALPDEYPPCLALGL